MLAGIDVVASDADEIGHVFGQDREALPDSSLEYI